ncbi:MAG: hypothetical protein A2X04_15770 [Bacteroidetes bacterium GWF2_41_9]|nr:MAG: hypothetical protein A2X04_15770 [Bacteroidetes bacterium GWF2_41_9]
MFNKVLLTGSFRVFLTLFSNGHVTITRENKRKLHAEIDSILQSLADLDKIPGAVIMIKKDGKIIHRKTYGFAQKYDSNHEILNHPEKMESSHLFDIASLTKVIGTTTSIMLLTDRGLISIEDPVFKYIKAFDTPEKRMVYDSTLGFTVKEIDPARWNGWRTYILKGEVNDGNAWYANEGISGEPGLFSTAADLQKLVDMLISKGTIDTKQFISSRIIESFLTKDKFNNALGWMMDPVNSFIKNAPEGSFGHTGFTGTSISVIPEEKISVILLINRQNTGLDDNGEYYNVNPVRLQVINAVLKYLCNN